MGISRTRGEIRTNEVDFFIIIIIIAYHSHRCRASGRELQSAGFASSVSAGCWGAESAMQSNFRGKSPHGDLAKKGTPYVLDRNAYRICTHHHRFYNSLISFARQELYLDRTMVEDAPIHGVYNMIVKTLNVVLGASLALSSPLR